jgi:hypothetical protein
MKLLFSLVSLSLIISSCSGPKAELELNKQTATIYETVRVENLSEGGDLTYIKMNGAGMLDKYIKLSADVSISHSRFNFVYDKPGNYDVEVFVETSNMFGSNDVVTKKMTLKITDPNAPVDPPIKPVVTDPDKIEVDTDPRVRN